MTSCGNEFQGLLLWCINKQKTPTLICLYCICSLSGSLNISWHSSGNVFLPCSPHSALCYLYNCSSRRSFCRPLICFIIHLWTSSCLAISVQSRTEFNEPAPQQHETGTAPSLLQLKVRTVVTPSITYWRYHIFNVIFNLLYNSLYCFLFLCVSLNWNLNCYHFFNREYQQVAYCNPQIFSCVAAVNLESIKMYEKSN